MVLVNLQFIGNYLNFACYLLPRALARGMLQQEILGFSPKMIKSLAKARGNCDNKINY
jgi:hypothetical protein